MTLIIEWLSYLLSSWPSLVDFTDFFDSVSFVSVLIGLHLYLILNMVYTVRTELMNVSFCFSDNTGVSMCRSP